MKVTEETQMNVKVPKVIRTDLRETKSRTKRSFASLFQEAWELARSTGWPFGSSKTRGTGSKDGGTDARPLPPD